MARASARQSTPRSAASKEKSAPVALICGLGLRRRAAASATAPGRATLAASTSATRRLRIHGLLEQRGDLRLGGHRVRTGEPRRDDGSSGLLEQALIRCPFLFPALGFKISTNTFIDGDEWNGCDFQKLRSGFSSTPRFVVT